MDPYLYQAARQTQDIEQLYRLALTPAQPSDMAQRLKTGLLIVAALFLGAGLIFWVAANWQDLPRWSRFLLVEAALTCALWLACYWRDGRTAALFCATLVLGALLALLGQTYQTGADAWQLFASWAALSLLWVGLSRNDLMWSLWVLIAGAGVVMWSGRFELLDILFVNPDAFLPGLLTISLWVVLACVPALVSCVPGLRVTGGMGWWSHRIALAGALVFCTSMGVTQIFADTTESSGALLVLLIVLVMLSLWVSWRGRFQDFVAICLSVFALNTLFLAGVARVLPDQTLVTLLLFSVVAMVCLAGSVTLLLKLQHSQKHQTSRCEDRSLTKRHLVGPRWWQCAYQQGLLQTDELSMAVQAPSALVIAMAMFGALVCLVPLLAFLVLLVGETWLIGMPGTGLGLLALVCGLILLRREPQGTRHTFVHCIGLVVWGLGAGLLLFNASPDSLFSMADWRGLCALALVVCLSGGLLTHARWVQILMGWATGVSAYAFVLTLFNRVPEPFLLQLVELGLYAAWWCWLLTERGRVARASRNNCLLRATVMADAAVVGILSGSVLMTQPFLMADLLSAEAVDGWTWANSALQVISVVTTWVATLCLLRIWQQRQCIERSASLMILLAGAVLSVCAWFCPALANLALLTAAALSGARWRVALLCAVAALVLLSGFYYSLNWTLAEKGLGLVVLGLVLLLATWLISRLGGKKAPFSARSDATSRVTAQQGWVWIIISAVLVLGLVNADVYRKEQVIAQGQRILVPLAPVDPRSLMQGDYMDLRFDLPVEVLRALESSVAATRYIRVHINADGVASFGALTDRSASADASERVMPLKRLKGRWVLVTDAYFFPEGQGQHYENARYGEFRVLARGDALLVGLADHEGRLIAP